MIDIIEHAARPAVIAPFVLFFIIQVFGALISTSKAPKNLPWVGKDTSKFFAETRAHLSSFKHGVKNLADGYEKYSKKGKSYICPDFSGRPAIVLPRSQISWILDQPDDVLSTSASHYEKLEGDYAFTLPRILEDPYHEHVIHKYLPRRLPSLVPDLQAEVAAAYDESWGTDTKAWKEVHLFNSVLFMSSRIVNRVIVGFPLCRDEDFLSNARSLMMDIIRTSAILRFTPWWLRFLIGPLSGLPNRWHYRNTAKSTVPLIKERLANVTRKEQDPDFSWEAPNDFLSWTIMLASAENRQDELTIDRISRRIIPIEFAALHTTAISIVNCLLDLASSDPSLQFLEGIRQEATAILSENKGNWSKANLARLHRADSAFRESMRVSNFMTQNITRKVMPKQGITNKVEGWHAAQGLSLTLDEEGIHHDSVIYPNPNEYDAFRFSRSQENSFSNDAYDHHKDESRSTMKNNGLITTSDSFLPFSHGRHACPGRYLVAVKAKMMLSYMVMNYDIEPLTSRPSYLLIGQSKVPPQNATLRVRRKQKSTSV